MTEPKLYNGPDPYNDIDKTCDTQVDFDYYEDHDFHKLIQKLPRSNQYLSIYHSNIESLNGKFESLERSLVNIGLSFDVIALTEIWLDATSSKIRPPGELPGYNKFV